ncbi:MAG TPA: hypothetical protein PKJ45_00535 [Rubrivivax sp.]|nr:hypothetical protein [Burkholderiales bacterium]HNU09832.1 hypothetical protein [Rubrivivax sp.]
MPLPHFESTLPMGAAELIRASVFQRRMELERDSIDEPASTRLSSLEPSLLQDLLRFESNGRRSELLEVLAGAVRHTSAVTVHLQLYEHVIALSVYPRQRLVHGVLPMEQFLELQLTELEVLRVERAWHATPDALERAGEPGHFASLARLLWELALRGARDELLPEIAGQAAYRITPTMDLKALELSGSLASACERLKRRTTNLREISEWPGFDRTRAMRMLNGLYLQSGLMISRTHPAATNEGWFASAN